MCKCMKNNTEGQLASRLNALVSVSGTVAVVDCWVSILIYCFLKVHYKYIQVNYKTSIKTFKYKVQLEIKYVNFDCTASILNLFTFECKSGLHIIANVLP